MKSILEQKNCPICGCDLPGREHSCMGTCDSPDGAVEYWACFPARDIFSVKPAETED